MGFLEEDYDQMADAAQAVAILSLSHLMGVYIQAAYKDLAPPVSPATSARIRAWAAREALQSLEALSDSLDARKAGQNPMEGVELGGVPFSKSDKKPRKTTTKK